MKRPRPNPAPALVRLATVVGCALSLGPTPAAARTRVPVPPSPDTRPAAAPWLRATEGPPPVLARGVKHPAIHGHKEHAGRRLFPRAAHEVAENRARREAIQRHPAGKGLPGADRCGRDHEVTQGESLWRIAADVAPAEPAAVGERVETIYRANQRIIGSDPDLILPGQLLFLPGDCSR